MALSFKRPTKGFIVTLIVVFTIAAVWGVTHYIDSDELTNKVGLWSTIVIGSILSAVAIWFAVGIIKSKDK